MRGRPGASFQCRPAIAGRLRQGQSALPLSGGPCAAAASGRRTGGRRVCLRCGGIECETGGVRCLYGRTVRPGWGNRTPVGSHPAVFKTAVIPFRQTRRWWRLLPPLNRSFRRVRRQQVKNGGSLLPGNRGDMQAWAFGVQGRLWTRMRSRAGFGAGWPGMVPAIAGTVCGAACWRHDVPPPDSAAVMSRRAIARHGVGGGGGGRALRGLAGTLRRPLVPAS